MSIERTETVDATAVRDGWVVLSIFEFGDGAAREDAAELLRAKLATYQQWVESPHFQLHFHRLPSRIELVCGEPPSSAVRTLCRHLGVDLVEGEIDGR